MMIRLRAAWEASTYFKPEPEAFEKFLETTLMTAIEVTDGSDLTHPDFNVGLERAKRLIDLMELSLRPVQEKALITEMAVPDGSDHTNPDFNVGLDRVKRLFDLMEQSLRPAQEKEKEKCRKRKAHAVEPRGEKKIRTCERDPVFLNHQRMFVTERNKMVPWPTELTKDGNRRSKHQIQVFCREYFLQESQNMNPPKNRDEFNTIFKEKVGRFLEVFHHPPPRDLFYAFLNTTAECGPKLWKMWCLEHGHDPPTEDMLKTLTTETGFKEFRWEMWRLAYKNAVDRGMCPATAARAGQLAEEFGCSEDAATIRKRFFKKDPEDPIVWSDEAQEKAAEFATAAAAEPPPPPPPLPPPLPPPPRASSDAAAEEAAAAAAATTSSAAGDRPTPTAHFRAALGADCCTALPSLPPSLRPRDPLSLYFLPP
jgi:hypothetical protein